MEQPSQQQDISALLKAIHEDRQAAKDKEKRDAWTKYVSLMIVALAVITAYGSLKAGGFSSKVLLSQSKASDEWAFFQAKSIKRSLAEMEARTGSTESQAEAKQRADRYLAEQDDIQRKAKAYEADRDQAAKHGSPLGTGIAALQIAIALASVCMITKRKSLWAGSSFLGAVGLIYLIYGLFLI
jgi:glucan-binding YG repeat protein